MIEEVEPAVSGGMEGMPCAGHPRPLKVLHCIPSLAGGGAERQLCFLAHGLQKRGVEVHVAYSRGGENFQLLRESGAFLHELKTVSSYDARILPKLREVVRSSRCDVVQTWLRQMAGVGVLVARLEGLPWVLTERSSARAYPPSLRVAGRLLVSRSATAIAANSLAGASYWRSRRSASCIVSVIPNALAPAADRASELPPAALEFEIPESASVVLIAGRYHSDKNAVQVARSLATVLPGRSDLHAVFLGEGPDREAVAAIADAPALGGRMHVGGFSRQVSQWMLRATLLLSASSFEGHPNAVLEGAAAGCPLLLSDIPAHREMFSEHEAAFLPGMDDSSIALAVTSALADPAGRAQRAGQAREKARSFTIDATTDAYLHLYSSLVQGKRAC